MAPKKIKHAKPSSEQRADADQRWADLEAQLDQEWPLHQESRLQTARILYEMKRWLKQWGHNKGRKGWWMANEGSAQESGQSVDLPLLQNPRY